MRYLTVLLENGYTTLPVAYSDTWLSDERLPYELFETVNGEYFELRKTYHGALVLFDVTDL